VNQPLHSDIQGNLPTDRIAPILKNYISSADTLAIGGLVAIKECGGPSIPFRGGRVDRVSGPSLSTRLPFQTDPYLIVKSKLLRMGLTPRQMAVLGKSLSLFESHLFLKMYPIVTGSHSLGGVHQGGLFANFDETPGIFDNLIFQKSLRGECTLPIECQIAQDPELRPYIIQ
jgi:hypothetical protein